MQFLKYVFREIVIFAILALLIVVPFRIFIAQPFIVDGSSMVPTFENGQYLIVDQLTYRFHEPQRGDVITFRYPKNISVFFIKRIIGLPGETVEISPEGKITIDHPGETPFTLSEPYIAQDHPSYTAAKYTLGNDEYFVMGDNRGASSDSRVWGPLPRKDIVGRVILRLLPPSKIGIFPGKSTYDTNN